MSEKYIERTPKRRRTMILVDVRPEHGTRLIFPGVQLGLEEVGRIPQRNIVAVEIEYLFERRSHY